MNALEFLTIIWPQDGYYCLAVPRFDKDKKPDGYIHFIRSSIPALADYIEAAKDKHNLFFCVNSLNAAFIDHPDEINRRTGKPGVRTFRTHENMKLSKALFCDLDVGPDTDQVKKYPTRELALAALDRFLFETGLPYPMVTSSGGGFHCFWLLEDTLPSLVWRQLALKFHAVFKKYKLHVDPSRVYDQSSVMRVVGTYNHKLKNKRPVVVLNETGWDRTHSSVVEARFDELLDGTFTPGVVQTREYPQHKNIDEVFDIAGSAPKNIAALGVADAPRFDGVAPTLEQVMSVCEQAKLFVEAKGCVSQTAWYAYLGLFQYMADGPRLIHEISSGDPRYNKGDTQAEADRWDASTKGNPASCATLASKCSPGVCEDCVFYSERRNPLVIARDAARKASLPAPVVASEMPDDEPEEIPPPPHPYSRVKMGIMVDIPAKKAKKEGEVDTKAVSVIIASYDMYPVSHLEKTAAGEHSCEEWVISGKNFAERRIMISSKDYRDTTSLIDRLRDEGVIITDANAKHVREFMSAYIRKLQESKMMIKQHDHLGWDDIRSSFILPDKVIHVDGRITRTALSAVAQGVGEYICKVGSLQEQIKLLEFYNNDKFIPHQIMIIASLASAWFYATNQNGMIVNATGESGSSKSTALYTAASLWGHPKGYVLNGQKEGSTVNARNSRTVTLCNLPLFVDENTNQDEQAAKSMAMNSSQATEKILLDRASRLKKSRVKEKSLLTICTSNDSMHQSLSVNNSAGTAGSMRVFEMECAKTFGNAEKAEAFFIKLNMNYGHIGPAFMCQTVPRREEVERMVMEEMMTLNKELATPGDERFWISFSGCLIAIGRIAVELGYIPFDMDTIRRYIVQVLFPALRGTVKAEHDSSRPFSVLTNYMAFVNGKLVKMGHPFSGGAPNAVDVPKTVEVVGRYEIHLGRLYISNAHFREYCNRHKKNALKVLTELHMAKVVLERNSKISLGKDAGLPLGRTPCFEVDMTHPDLAIDAQHLQTTPLPPQQPTPPRPQAPPPATVH
jgi:hypothetical protein